MLYLCRFAGTSDRLEEEVQEMRGGRILQKSPNESFPIGDFKQI